MKKNQAHNSISGIIITAALLACIATAVTGCRHSSEIEDDAPYIGFNSLTPAPIQSNQGRVQSKAGAGDIITNTDEKLRQSSFGIFGYKSVVEGNNPTNVFVGSTAEEVGWDNTLNAWTYSPKRRWEQNMHYSFRAYWPFSAEVNPASDAKRIAVEYRSTTQQYDLLVAYATRYPLEEGISTVPMRFKHTLAGLKFNIRFKDTEDTGENDITTDYVTKFYMTGLYSVGSMIYGQQEDSDDPQKIDWIINENNYDESTRMFEWTGREKFELMTGSSASVFDNDKVVLIIPQTLSHAADKPTKAYFYTEAGGDAIHEVTLPKTVLKPGFIYTFNFLIHSSYLTIDIDIQDWNKIQSNVDINL